MKWEGRRRSSNVEDRRGMSRPVAIGGGIGTIVLLVAGLLLGIDPGLLTDLTGGGEPGVTAPGPTDPAQDRLAEFVSVVLAETEDTWHTLFQEGDATYAEPTLVLFTDAVQSACGYQGAAVGPFYCPADQKVYLDLSFFRQMQERLGAPGDFARAYVVAHEVGHHVQTLLGTSERVHNQRQRLSPEAANRMSVRLELQADCFAGVWAHHADRTAQILEPGDLREAVEAAAAIGDDALQREAGQVVRPDAFTHGSSEQRMRWLQRGYERGTIDACDTFAAEEL